jgi:transposase InsO family protein
MDLRVEFLNRLAQGERLVDLCRDYGISRKTAQKFKARFAARGKEGLTDLSRAPLVIPHKTPPEMAELIVAERRAHPTWGPRKLKVTLERRLGRPLPSHSAIGAVLARAGIAAIRPPRRRHRSQPTMLREAAAPNDVWCIDYKGQFRLGDRSYCYPLTITDQHSRYLLACEGMAAISDEAAREVCAELFRVQGLPTAIRSDNGAPFASTGLAGLTKLSAYWLKLGIVLERTRPASPQDNGAHERMHRTLKAETTRPARRNLLQQQEVFDTWSHEFNHERPHEALAMRCPGDVYVSSPRRYPDAPFELEYPMHDDTVKVNNSGSITIAKHGTVHVSPALAGESVGIREELDGRWLVTFACLDLGHTGAGRALVPPSTIP